MQVFHLFMSEMNGGSIQFQKITIKYIFHIYANLLKLNSSTIYLSSFCFIFWNPENWEKKSFGGKGQNDYL